MNYFLFAVSDCAVCVNQSKVASLIHTSEQKTDTLFARSSRNSCFLYLYLYCDVIAATIMLPLARETQCHVIPITA